MVVNKYCHFIVNIYNADNDDIEFISKLLTHSDCTKNFYFDLFYHNNHLHVLVGCDRIVDLNEIRNLMDVICSCGLFAHSLISVFDYDKFRSYLSSHSH